MPLRRDSEGNVVPGPTDLIDPPGEIDTEDRAGGSGGSLGAVEISRPTASPRNPRDPGRRAEPTKPARGGQGATKFFPPRKDPGSVCDPPVDDPPVGWLVIVDGPGKGRVATLGIGVNHIGRARTQRVSLDHGDEMISRENHGAITYEPNTRKFYVQGGGGSNLTYVDGEVVLVPREIEALAHVKMGNTELRFVPLCSPDFSWDDESSDE